MNWTENTKYLATYDENNDAPKEVIMYIPEEKGEMDLKIVNLSKYLPAILKISQGAYLYDSWRNTSIPPITSHRFYGKENFVSIKVHGKLIEKVYKPNRKFELKDEPYFVVEYRNELDKLQRNWPRELTYVFEKDSGLEPIRLSKTLLALYEIRQGQPINGKPVINIRMYGNLIKQFRQIPE